ncbi:hypothetical protein AGLY_007502 [Aphis glycines]|uniref:Uncharacterized protein n=1 Tax=Aphis glycines TaxID=307491 RepID=A0A6G0TMM9_APHGL|nr:hypothetical protein AGLY_007502 [Aphis glycines]
MDIRSVGMGKLLNNIYIKQFINEHILKKHENDNLSAAVLKPTTPTSLNGKKNPAQSKNILLPNPPKTNFPARESFKVNPVASLNNPAPPAPPSPPLLPTATLTPPVKLPVSLASTKVPPEPLSPKFIPNLKKENINNRESNIVEEGDDDDEEEVEEIEDDDHEHPLENSKTTGTLIPSSSTSKPTVPEIVKQEKDNHQGSDIGEEGDNNEEEDDYEYYEEEEPLEKSKTTSKPISSSLTSNPTLPEIVKQEKDNHQGSDIGEEGDNNEEGDDYEYYEEEEPLEKSKTVASISIPSSSTFKLTVPNIVKQEDNRRGSNIGEKGDGYEGDDYEEEDDYEEGDDYKEYNDDTVVDGHNSKYNLKYSNYSTLIPTNNIINDGVRVNPPVTMNSPITTEPQLSKDELIENNYNDSEYSTNTNEDNIENQSNDQYVSENKERILNGYTALKKILYMLHDYASLTFNWIINKINYRMEHNEIKKTLLNLYYSNFYSENCSNILSASRQPDSIAPCTPFLLYRYSWNEKNMNHRNGYWNPIEILITKSGNGIVYLFPKNLFNKYINPILISSKDLRSMFLAAGPTIHPSNQHTLFSLMNFSRSSLDHKKLNPVLFFDHHEYGNFKNNLSTVPIPNQKWFYITCIAFNLYSGRSGSNNSLHKFFKTPRLIVFKIHYASNQLSLPLYEF